MYKVLIGIEKVSVLDFTSNYDYKIVNEINPPFGLFDNIIKNLVTANEIFELFTRISCDIEENIPISIVVGSSMISDNTKKQFYIALHKIGLYRNRIIARENISFENSVDLNTNNASIENLLNTNLIKNEEGITKTTKYDYGIFDSYNDNVYIVIPKNTNFKQLTSFDKRKIIEYKYYVDVEQMDFCSNRFVIEIYEENNERLYIDFNNARTSGEYRIYFYINKRETHLCIAILDLLRNEWLDIPEDYNSSFLMG